MDDKEMKRIISSNLKTILKEYNINQSDLAKIAGVSESTAGKWILQKSAPRMGAIQKIADHFNLPKSYILEEKRNDYIPYPKISEFPYYPISISAGQPIEVEGITDVETISMPAAVMGKWAGSKDVYMMRVNGESMNNIIPHNSLIAVKQVELTFLKNGDIVVYSDNHDYSVKRFYDDKQNKRFIFRPDSNDNSFTDHVVPYSEAKRLRIHGKVVLYIVELD